MRILPFILFGVSLTAYAGMPDSYAGLPLACAKTAAHFCVGIVATGFKAPRAVLPLANGDLIVADMGSWEANKGRLWRLHQQNERYTGVLIGDKLDRPNSLASGPDGMVYLTLAGRVARFDPRLANPAIVDVIGGKATIPALPSRGRHILAGLTFNNENDLFVSVGSASDHCETEDGAQPKPRHLHRR